MLATWSRAALAAALITLPNSEASSQSTNCVGDWSPVHVGLRGLDGDLVTDAVTFDDGTGSTLYVSYGDGAQFFSHLPDGPVHGVLRWNGVGWETLTTNGPEQFVDLHVHDFGNGDVLLGVTWAAGHCVRWDGSDWVPLASPDVSGINGLVTYDDGSGPALHAYGRQTINDAAAGPLRGISRFDGTTFVPLEDPGGNVTGLARAAGTSVNVRDAVVVPGPSRDELVVVGHFDQTVDPPSGALQSMPGVARWTGDQWVGYGSEFEDETGSIHAAAWFDDGSGATVYVGGRFDSTTAGTARGFLRWTGSTWAEVGSGVGALGNVETLDVIEVGGTPQLAVGGRFSRVGSTWSSGLAFWGAGGWTTFGRGLNVAPPDFPECAKVVPVTLGGQQVAVAVGDFDSIDSVTARSVAVWDGAAWSSLTAHEPRELGWAQHFGMLDIGQGPELFAWGSLSFAGSQATAAIAKWNGAAWEPFGPLLEFQASHGQIETVTSLVVHDDGNGPALYASARRPWRSQGQLVRGVVRWTGSAWTQVGDGLDPGVDHLVVHDDGSGPALYAFGQLDSSGATPIAGVARWDGVSWSQVGAGLERSFSQPTTFTGVTSIDLGAGPRLYAHGNFDESGGTAITSPAIWDGTAWAGVPGVDYAGGDLVGVDTPAGPRVVLMGRNNYTLPGGGVARGIVAWNGTALEPFGDGLTFDGGAVDGRMNVAPFASSSGADHLIAVGEIASAGGLPANGIAFWNGTDWTLDPAHPTPSTRGGVMAPIAGIAGLPDGLFFSGRSDSLPTANSTNSFTDPNVWNVLTPCSVVDVGTDYCVAEVNSTGVAAQLDGSYSGGSPLDGVVIRADQLPVSSTGYLLGSLQQGFTPLAGGSSGNLCLGGSIGRFNRAGEVFLTGASGTAKLTVDPLDVPQPTGVVAVQPGESWSFQVWYRDIGPTSNFTRGLEIQF